MPDITIVKLKVRRGTDEQRQSVTLEQGELGYTADTNRTFIGDGVTVGGSVVGTKMFSILGSNGGRVNQNDAYKNDIVYENNFLYQLSGTDYSALSAWAFIGTSVDNSSLEYNASTRILEVKDAGIGPSKLAANSSYAFGGLTTNLTNGISANIDNNTIVISGSDYNLMVPDGGIDQSQIADGGVGPNAMPTSNFGPGLFGGGGALIETNIDDVTIVYSQSALSVGTISASNILLGDGVEVGVDGVLQATLSSVDGVSIEAGTNGIALTNKFAAPSAVNLPAMTVNEYGVVTTIQKTVARPLSGIAGSNGGFYNDNIGHTAISVVSGLGETSVVSLSSAGFAIIDLGISEDGLAIGNVAIPI